MTKVVIIGPNIGMGGVERASSNLANGFAEANIIVKYIALIPKSHFYEIHPKVNYVQPISFNQTKIDLIKSIKYIRKEIKSFNPDAIVGFTKFYAALTNLALLGTKYKVFVTERSSPLYQWPKYIEVFCKMSFNLRKVRGVISQTTIASEYHQKYYQNSRYTVIHNALREVTKYPSIKRENIILAAGRFGDSCKGFDLLVAAFNIIKNKDWKLVFAGGTKHDGEYLLKIAANESVQRRIEFLGSIKDIDKIYARAGIFVMPSRTEGFPNALIEAMAAGCPCISFNFVAGPSDIITNNVDGIIVEAENISELANAIDTLIGNEEKRTFLSTNSVKISSRLNKNVIVKQHLDFILQ